MSDKGKARKLEDRTKARGLPMGAPGMVPHHNYTLSSDNFHSAGGRLPYRAGLGPMMGQSLPMGPPLTRVPSGLSNDYDLGPPIFMPSLNLGPKPSGTSNVPTPLPSSSLSNSKLAASMSSSATAAFISADMLTYHTSQAGGPLSAFHSSGLSGHVPPYMGGPHPSSKPSTSSIAKPTPISMGTHPGPKGSHPKVVPGQLDTSAAGGKQLKGSPQGGVVKFLGASEGGVKGDGLVLSQAYYSTPGSVLNSPSNSLSRILAASSSSPSPSSSQDPQQASSPGSKPSSTAAGSFAAVMTDAYAVRSPGMAPPTTAMAPPTPATTGQPSSNATFADTRLDRPPQPSALQNPAGGVVPGKDLSQQQLQGKDRLTTAEVASNIIISNPGLTGKHIAAMTNSSTQSQPSHLLPHSAYSSPIISQSSISSAQELLPHPHSLLLNQHMVDPPPWGFPPHHNSNHMFHTPLSPPVSMTTGLGGGGGQDITSSGSGLKSRLESPVTSVSQSPLQGGVGPPGPGGGGGTGEQGVPSSPSQVSSMRPRILRGKRSVDGNWKLEQQTNSLQNSPGSPHRTKLPSNLKKSVLASPAAVSASSGEQVPPTSPSTDGPHPFNHVGGVNRLDPGTPDTSGSPRKKPRKQNVIATDDQYASNVPDTTQQQPLLLSQRQGADETSLLSPEDSKGRGGVVAGEGGGGCGKEVEIRYLSQLRQCPYPINGVYKLKHNTAHNHFRSPADIKHRETLPLSVYDLANAKSSQVRASGWKLFHFSSQLEEVCRVEGECLAVVGEIQRSLDTLTQDSTCLLNSEALRTTTDLLQGNVDRCNRVISHVDSTKANMFMVLDQKSQVLDVLDKYSNFKSYYSSISPSLSSSSSNQHKSHS